MSTNETSKTSSTAAPSMGHVQLITPRLLLRAPQESDIPDFFTICSDPKVMKYWSFGPHATLADTEAWYYKGLISPFSGTYDFVIVLPSEQRAIGKIGLWNGEEIGFMLNSDYWGRGYASEAMNALLEHVWRSNLDLAAMTADVDPRNQSSLKVLKKFGFVETKLEKNTMETHIGWCDSQYLELKRPGT